MEPEIAASARVGEQHSGICSCYVCPGIPSGNLAAFIAGLPLKGLPVRVAASKRVGAKDAFSPQRVARWQDPAGGFIHAPHAAEWGGMHNVLTGKGSDNKVTYEGGRLQPTLRSDGHPDEDRIRALGRALRSLPTRPYTSNP